MRRDAHSLVVTCGTQRERRADALLRRREWALQNGLSVFGGRSDRAIARARHHLFQLFAPALDRARASLERERLVRRRDPEEPLLDEPPRCDTALEVRARRAHRDLRSVLQLEDQRQRGDVLRDGDDVTPRDEATPNAVHLDAIASHRHVRNAQDALQSRIEEER